MFNQGLFMKHTAKSDNRLRDFVKSRRKLLGLSQTDLASRSGVGLRFVRDLEQGKRTLRIDKVNQVLSLFGHELAPSEFLEMSRN
jgi:y4mF family transcriptional regulator